jgi:hypothetical protein
MYRLLSMALAGHTRETLLWGLRAFPVLAASESPYALFVFGKMRMRCAFFVSITLHGATYNVHQRIEADEYAFCF